FYALAFYLADRYEREPVWMGIVAFLWGAIPAIVTSLIGELVIGIPFVGDPGSLTAAIVESALVAPFVEEIAKGAALYAIYRFLRHEFDGVLDGLTYGALIGFGFAMTENFLYFIGAFSEGGFVDLTVLIFLRAIVFGLNHALYTGLFGIGLGMARHATTPQTARLWIAGGFVAAVAAHALHNLGASISSVNGFGIVLSLGLAVGGIALIFVVVLLTWQQERRWLRDELKEEVGVLLSRAEYDSLVGGWRRSPLLNARTNPQRAKQLHSAVELAFCKHRLRRLGPGREPKLAGRIDDLRREVAA
nr:PrsW family intramembrane metalloprotease [Caldilineaceae bacterium]